MGQTISTLKERWKQHVKDSKRARDIYFYRAIRKYGPDSFKLEVLSNVTAETDELLDYQLDNLERLWIGITNAADGRVGYNSTYGGEGGRHNQATRAKLSAWRLGRKATNEERAKMSEARTGEKNHFYGRSHSESSKAKISAKKVGTKHTPEHKAKIGAGQVGRRHSEDTKTKMSLWQVGRELPQETKDRQSATKRAKNPNPSAYALYKRAYRERKKAEMLAESAAA